MNVRLYANYPTAGPISMRYASEEIQIWEYANAPERLKQIASLPTATWLAFIPARLISEEVEALFMRWDSEAHPVSRRQLDNGALILSGEYPAAETLAAAGTSSDASGHIQRSQTTQRAHDPAAKPAR